MVAIFVVEKKKEKKEKKTEKSEQDKDTTISLGGTCIARDGRKGRPVWWAQRLHGQKSSSFAADSIVIWHLPYLV